MHELSIINGLVKSIEAERKKRDFKKVKEIEVLCGRHDTLSKDHLQFDFDAVVKNDYLKGAKLTIKTSPDMNGGIYLNKLEVEE